MIAGKARDIAPAFFRVWIFGDYGIAVARVGLWRALNTTHGIGTGTQDASTGNGSRR